MKRKLLTFGTVALFLIGVSFFTSCGDTQSTDNQEEHEQMVAIYACPMHKEITGKNGENCSKCGMPLEKVEEDHSGHNHD